MHRNLVNGVLEALEWSFGRDIYMDKVLERLFRERKNWGKRDRAFIAEHAYTIVRNWRLLWYLHGEEQSLKRKSLWKFFYTYALWRDIELPEWPEFEMERQLNSVSTETPLEIRESYAQWFHDLASEELGEAWQKIAVELNKEAQLVIRTNTLHLHREQLLKELQDEGLSAAPLTFNEIGLVLSERVSTQKLESFQKGLFEVQDGGSQLIAPALRPEEGMLVIDACAGAGGKSLHLACLMKNRGRIIAMDVEKRKLKELQRRARHQSASIIETREISEKQLTELRETADRLLLDVPCSGSGVIKRKPDTKWKLKPEYLREVQEKQSFILNRYTDLLKPGGIVVYATCSILPSENEDQIRNFLNGRTNYKLLKEQRILPQIGSDGYYFAVLERTI